jgi:hypothetical protein
MTGRIRAVTAASVALVVGLVAFTYLRGTHEKMVRQNAVAREDRLVFATTPQQIADLVSARQLVPLPGSVDYTTKGVSYAFARPEILTFVEALAHDYRGACGGEALVITSLVRPLSRQPRNASPLSVHPAGMAVDFHIPAAPACRGWLVQRLLTLASANVLDVTEEMHPHHLHVAVFPHAYMAWLAGPWKPPAGAHKGNLVLASGRGAKLTFLAMGDTRAAIFVSGLIVLVLVAAGPALRRRVRSRGRHGRFRGGTRSDVR